MNVQIDFEPPNSLALRRVEIALTSDGAIEFTMLEGDEDEDGLPRHNLLRMALSPPEAQMLGLFLQQVSGASQQ